MQKIQLIMCMPHVYKRQCVIKTSKIFNFTMMAIAVHETMI